MIVLEKSHKDEAQRVQLGAVQTQLEHQMTLKVRAAKSLNIQQREKLDKMFPENCPSGCRDDTRTNPGGFPVLGKGGHSRLPGLCGRQ